MFNRAEEQDDKEHLIQVRYPLMYTVMASVPQTFVVTIATVSDICSNV